LSEIISKKSLKKRLTGGGRKITEADVDEAILK
jgi:hypothetical protein